MCVSVAWHCNDRFTHRERRGEVGWGQREREEGREGEIERERRGGVGTQRERKGERARLRERGEVGWGHRERGRERGRD